MVMKVSICREMEKVWTC